MNNIVQQFFDRDFEIGINECLFYRKYEMDKDKVKQYIDDVINTPITDFLEYVISKKIPSFFPVSSVVQFSSIHDSTTKICQKLDEEGDEGYDMAYIGRLLLDDGMERNIAAYRKYGENQSKTAVEFGLVQELYNYYYLSCLGKIFNELETSTQVALLRRTILRNHFIQRLISLSQKEEISIRGQLSSFLKESTAKRRLSNIKSLFEIIRGVDGLADPYILNIKEIEAVKQMELPITVEISSKSNQGFRQKKTILKVTFPDGIVICKNTANETFVDVINHIGPQKVAQLGFTVSNKPMMSKEQLEGCRYLQHSLNDGWWVIAPTATVSKRKLLEKISYELSISFMVEDVPLRYSQSNIDIDSENLMAKSNPETWVLPWAPQQYDLAQRIKDYGYLYWNLSDCLLQKFDIVYVYESAPASRIRYKFIIENVGVHMTAEEFQKDLPYQTGKCAFTIGQIDTKLRFIDEYDSELLGRECLIKNGVNGNIQGPMKATVELVNYIENLPSVKAENAKRGLLTYYKIAFSSLDCLKVKGCCAPHKPILLLSVLELIDEGKIVANKIFPSDNLVIKFNKVWRTYVSEESSFSPNCWTPFYHLQTDGFWHWGSLNDDLSVIRGIRSQKQLKKHNIYAFFDNDLFELLMDGHNRTILRNSLLSFFR